MIAAVLDELDTRKGPCFIAVFSFEIGNTITVGVTDENIGCVSAEVIAVLCDLDPKDFIIHDAFPTARNILTKGCGTNRKKQEETGEYFSHACNLYQI